MASRRPRYTGNITRSAAARALTELSCNHLAVIFFALCIIHFLWFDATPPEFRRASYASIINSTIWNTALLIAIALRKSWARLILLTILGLGIAGGLAFTPMFLEIPAFLTISAITLGILAVSFAWLLYSRDVRRLVGRDYE